MLTLDAAGFTARGRTRLHPTTLQVQPSTATLVVGRNGSGKSTLVSIMAAELRASTGAVLLGTDDVRSLQPRTLAQRRAVLGQEQAVSFGFRVREVVSWGRYCWSGTDQQVDDDAVIDLMLAEQGIAHLADRPLTELSGGERQRVHLARVRAQQASVLLLDEADASLDPEGRHHLAMTARAEADRGRAVVLVSHDVMRHLAWVDRVIAVAGGRIALDTAAADVDRAALADVLGAPLG